jgi:glycosyltransferase involved in cell wall biosynthesis
VENGKNGYVVQENNVNDLYKAMKTIIDLDFKLMGKISRKIFEEKNNFITMADGFTNAINYVNIKKG